MAKRNSKTRAYHHGTLKEDFIEAALKFLEKHSLEELSLKTLALNLGVSQAAPYRHFKDRRTLLATMAQQVFDLRFSYIVNAIENHWASAHDLYHACAHALFRVALERPEHYKLIFLPQLSPFDKYPNLLKSASSSFLLTKKVIEQCQKKKIVSPGNANEQTMRFWTVVSGFSLLYAERSLIWMGIEKNNASQALKSFVEQFRVGQQAPIQSEFSFERFQVKKSELHSDQTSLLESEVDEILKTLI